MLALPPHPWPMVRASLVVAAVLVTTVVSARGQATPEGPSTLNGAWTLRSFPPTAFPESAVPEAARLTREAEELRRQGRHDEANKAFRQAIVADPSHPSAYWRLAAIGNSDYKARAALIHQQIAMGPSPPAYLHGAVILQALGQPGASLMVWREGVSRYPADRNMAALFGEALLRHGQVDEALGIFEREVLARPNSSRLRLQFGRALIAMGAHEAGLGELRQAARLEDSPLMWSTLARVLAAVRLDLDSALDFARRAAEAAEADSADRSQSDMGRLLNDTISLIRAWDTLSRVYAARNELDAAESYGTAAWRLSPDVDTLLRLGVLYRDAGQIDAAADYLARAASGGTSVSATEARRLLESLTPTRPIDDLAREGLARAQRSLVATFAQPAGPEVRARLVIRIARDGRVVDARAASGGGDELAPYLASVQKLTLPGLPAGATVDELQLPWVLTCETSGGCRLAPVVVPRTSPFDVE
jgi:tetratricopeptide (TPR) repeat protein